MRNRYAFLLGTSALFVVFGLFTVASPARATEKEGLPCIQNEPQTCEMFVSTPGGTDDRAVFKIYQEDGIVRSVVYPYGPFRGSIQVRRGDTDGDGQDEFVTVPEHGGGPQVRVWSRLGDLEASFFAYDTKFRGGLNLALGDLDGNGTDEIIVAPRGEGGPNVRVYTYDTTTQTYILLDWVMAYDASFHGGIQLHTGNVNPDDNEELIVSPRTGAGSIKVYNVVSGELVETAVFFPFAIDYDKGLRVRIGNVMGDSKEEIVVTPNEGANPEVKVYGWNGEAFTVLDSFLAYGGLGPVISATPLLKTGLSLQLGDIAGDTYKEIITAAFTGGGVPIRVWKAGSFDADSNGRLIAERRVFSATIRGLNLLTRNVAPDSAYDVYNTQGHDEIIIAPRGFGGPMILVLRFEPRVRGHLEVIRQFFAFSTAFRGETRFDDDSE